MLYSWSRRCPGTNRSVLEADLDVFSEVSEKRYGVCLISKLPRDQEDRLTDDLRTDLDVTPRSIGTIRS